MNSPIGTRQRMSTADAQWAQRDTSPKASPVFRHGTGTAMGRRGEGHLAADYAGSAAGRSPMP